MKKNSLTGRERIIRAVNYQEVDRVPYYFRAEPEVITTLIKELGVRDINGLESYFDVDAVRVGVPFKPEAGHKPLPDGSYTDMFGMQWKKVTYNNISTTTVVKPAFNENTAIADIENYPWPDAKLLDQSAATEQAKAARARGRAVYGGSWASIFTFARYLIGEENFFIMASTEPEVIQKLIDRLTDYHLEINETYFKNTEGNIDVFYMGSDFGTQKSLFISIDMFRRFFKPNFTRLAKHAKKHGLKVMMHSCGSIFDLISEFIDCGIDIVDPVQVSADNMSPESLAAAYKKKIVFHGGISTQKTLPFGTPVDIRNEVRSAIAAFGPSGYIVAPDQNIQADTPVNNILALFDAFKNQSR